MANQYDAPNSKPVEIYLANNTKNYLQSNLKPCEIGIANDTGEILFSDKDDNKFTSSKYSGTPTPNALQMYNGTGLADSVINQSATKIGIGCVPTNTFQIAGIDDLWTGMFLGTPNAHHSYGMYCASGLASDDYCAIFSNATQSANRMSIRGDGKVNIGAGDNFASLFSVNGESLFGTYSGATYPYQGRVAVGTSAGNGYLQLYDSCSNALMMSTHNSILTVSGEIETPGIVLNGGSALTRHIAGSFTATLSGFTTTVSGTAHYEIIEKICVIHLPYFSGTPNAATHQLTGIPANITNYLSNKFETPLYDIYDNGATSGRIIWQGGANNWDLRQRGDASWGTAGTFNFGTTNNCGAIITILLDA